MTRNPRELLTPRQLSRAIGVSEASIKRWCDQGEIESSRTSGGHRRLPIASVLEFLKRTNHPVARPELLGVPSTTGKTEWTVSRERERFWTAIASGQEAAALQIIAGLLDSEHALSAIADDILLSDDQRRNLSNLNDGRSDESLAIIVHSLRSRWLHPDTGAPAAFTAALDGVRDSLRVTLAELVLRERGWNATSLGTGLPFATLVSAIRRHTPRLLLLHVESIRDPERFSREMNSLHEATVAAQARLLVTGAAISEEFAGNLAVDAWRPTFRSLAEEALPKRRA